MRVRVSCDLGLHLAVATPLILMLRPQSGALQQVLKETYSFSHPVAVDEYSDIFGNSCRRIVAPAVEFEIHVSAEVETPDRMDEVPGAPFVNVEDLPIDVLGYLVPTRYCESDRLGGFTRAILADAVADTLLGYDQVSAIVAWIRNNVRYVPGSSEIPLSADEIRKQGHGVCRDLTHLGIAMCRSISIPARMVVGYLVCLDPMDLHAWFEVYVGNRWYTFDPTQTDLIGARVSIAYGRDAADVAMFHQFGPLPTISTLQVTADIVTD
ncbi:MAG: transglutaminase family protein [Gammaproteobacteria bacterium]|nr:transglutaminase family protein [Gammaproteobacteria bacterium]